MQTQNELNRKSDLRKSKNKSKKKRVYCGQYALSNVLVCSEFGDLYRRVALNNQASTSAKWRCATRRMMNAPTSHGDDETRIYRWDRMEVLLVEKIRNFIESLSDHELPKPYNIFVTLLNLNNKTAVDNSFGDSTPSGPITQTVIKIVPAYINEEVSLGEALFPLLTNLAHTFGYDYTSLYSNDGIPNPNVF